MTTTEQYILVSDILPPPPLDSRELRRLFNMAHRIWERYVTEILDEGADPPDTLVKEIEELVRALYKHQQYGGGR